MEVVRMTTFNAAGEGVYGRGNDVLVSVMCDAIKAVFRYQLFIFFIDILKQKVAFRKQCRRWKKCTLVRIIVIYLYHGGPHGSGNIALMRISICIQL